MTHRRLVQLVVFVCLTIFCAAAWAADMGAINSAETKTGTLSSPTYQDTWTFSGNVGDRVVITTNSAAVQPEIFLYPPGGGSFEASSQGSAGSQQVDHQLLQSSTYTILIRDWQFNQTGQYYLSLAKIPGAVTSPTDTDGGTILPAQTLTGTINQPSDTDMFQFTGTVGDRVVITTNSAAVQPEIFLYPPGGGSFEASSQGSAGSQQVDHQLLQSGTYTILIRDWQFNQTGQYYLSLAKIPGAVTSPTDTDGGTILPAQTLTGTINQPSDTDMFQFTGTVGDRVVITTNSAAVQPEIFLYPPGGGSFEASSQGSAGSQQVDHQLLQSGTYTILIRDWQFNQTGQYYLSLAKIPGAVTSPTDTDGGTILPAQTLTGTINQPSDTDMFQFTGTVGDRVVITTNSAAVQPEIFLYPPGGGSFEASSQGSAGSQQVDHQLLQSGTYTILIRDWQFNQTGQYYLSLAKIPGAVTSPTDTDGGTILPAQTLTGTINQPSDTDMFQFTGTVGDRVVITTNSAAVQPEIFLYPPGGGSFEASSQGFAGNQQVDHQLLQSGTYTILIRDWQFNQTGAYNLKLEKTPLTPGPGIYNPFPYLGTSTNDFIGHLSWDAVPGATGYNVYFGVNGISPLVKIGDNVSAPMLALPNMDPLTVYYWQVVAHTPSGDIPGPIQWFKTGIFDCEGDFGNNGTVNAADLALFVPGFGRSNCTLNPACEGDFDGDFDVDGTDIANMIQDYGRTDCPRLELNETFSSPGAPAGWINDGSGTWSVPGGAYRMTGIKPAAGIARFTYYNTIFEDFTFQADITKVQGSFNPSGLLFRGDGTLNNVYVFRVDADGNYAFAKFVSGALTVVIPPTYSSAINKGLNVSNTLRVACHGETIQFYVNDQLVNVIEDADLATGRAGLYATDDSTAVNIVNFDNVEVYSIEIP